MPRGDGAGRRGRRRLIRPRALHPAAPRVVVWAAAALLLAPGAVAGETPVREPVVGLPCEGCEDVFLGMPDTIASRVRIAPAGEPGEPLRIEGTVTDAAGDPVPGVIVYAYHTDDRGVYPPEEADGRRDSRHGRLRAWVSADDAGRYRFDTIRPAGYPGTRVPAHVHMHVIEPGRCTYYIASIHFADDPRLSEADRERFREGRGGGGLLEPARDEDGVWVVRRDIVLGRDVPGYPGR